MIDAINVIHLYFCDNVIRYSVRDIKNIAIIPSFKCVVVMIDAGIKNNISEDIYAICLLNNFDRNKKENKKNNKDAIINESFIVYLPNIINSNDQYVTILRVG